MTQTIGLEIDVHAAAESQARQEHCTVEDVVNEVLRRTLVATVPADSTSSEPTPRHLTIDPDTGLPAVKCSKSFTSDDVYRSEFDIT